MKSRMIVSASLFFLVMGTAGYSQDGTSQKAISARQVLAQQAEEFRKEVIRITDGVYMAVGFDGSNCAMIEGADGLIIIDTLRAAEAAEAVAAEFRKITAKPVKAIILTHSHEDHIGGASVFAGKDKPEIFSRANFSPDTDANSPVAPAILRRGVRMFGRDLPDKDITIRGVAPGKTPTGGVGKASCRRPKCFRRNGLK